MPTYTYKCTNEECDEFDKEFEIYHSMKEPNRTTCEKCGKESLSKVIGTTQVMLMGEGWDRNDSRGYLHDKKYN